MKIKVITVGKQKEIFYKNSIEFYRKKLMKRHKLELIEVEDEKTPENNNLDKKIKETEGNRILSKLEKKDFIISLDIKGVQIDTHALGEIIRDNKEVRNNISFIIGGSLGLSEEVLKKSDLRISFSKMTFPHQMMKLILLEQINRL